MPASYDQLLVRSPGDALAPPKEICRPGGATEKRTTPYGISTPNQVEVGLLDENSPVPSYVRGSGTAKFVPGGTRENVAVRR